MEHCWILAHLFNTLIFVWPYLGPVLCLTCKHSMYHLEIERSDCLRCYTYYALPEREIQKSCLRHIEKPEHWLPTCNYHTDHKTKELIGVVCRCDSHNCNSEETFRLNVACLGKIPIHPDEVDLYSSIQNCTCARKNPVTSLERLKSFIQLRCCEDILYVIQSYANGPVDSPQETEIRLFLTEEDVKIIKQCKRDLQEAI